MSWINPQLMQKFETAGLVAIAGVVALNGPIVILSQRLDIVQQPQFNMLHERFEEWVCNGDKKVFI